MTAASVPDWLARARQLVDKLIADDDPHHSATTLDGGGRLHRPQRADPGVVLDQNST